MNPEWELVVAEDFTAIVGGTLKEAKGKNEVQYERHEMYHTVVKSNTWMGTCKRPHNLQENNSGHFSNFTYF